MKATDKWAVPLTHDEHMSLHLYGSRLERQWFVDRGVSNVYLLAEELWANRRDEERMREVVAVHREL